MSFLSRKRNELTAKFRALQAIASSIKATSAVLDGEIVALDENGMPCFEKMRSTRRDCEIVFYAFDLLVLDGADMTELPLLKRKAALKRILPRRKTGRLRFTEYVMGAGVELFQELERTKLEGMVAKRLDSMYIGGRTRAWLKIKTSSGREEMLKRSEGWSR